MNPIDEDLRRRVNELVDADRDRCLWFLREDYYPTDLPDVLRTVDYIRRYGDREAFRKAGELYQRPSVTGQDAIGVRWGWKRILAWPIR